jgi:peptidyl-prolyl cis-trans isomerase C
VTNISATMTTPTTRARRLPRALLPAAAGAALAFPIAAALLRAQPAGGPGAAPAPAAPATRPGPAAKPGPDTVVITVGDDKVTVREFDMFLESLSPQDAQMARGPFRRAWAESYANMKLLAREAQKRKLDQAPETQIRLANVRDQVLANAMVVGVQETLDPAALKKYYDEQKATLERVSARHILIRFKGSKVPLRPGQPDLSEAEAKTKAEQLVARIKAGEDFARLAKAESDDVGSGEEGGDLGSFNRGRMVAPFEQAAFSQKENEIGNPVRSDFGYHVIQVTGKFDSFEKLADTIRQQLAPQRTNQLVRELRGQTPVVLNDAVLGPPQPLMVDPTTGGDPAGTPATKPASPSK